MMPNSQIIESYLSSFTFERLRDRFVIDGDGLTHPGLNGDFLLFRTNWNGFTLNGDPGTPYEFTADDLTRSDWRVL